MRIALALIAIAGVGYTQPPLDPALAAQMAKVFPDATSFSPKAGDPPHFNAMIVDRQSGAQTVSGYAFWTTDLEPLERGYEGPIKMLVGMDLKGLLTGVLVVDHHEPYGFFSIERPEFAAQFKGKKIRDPFQVGRDIDAVSRATMSISSATRAIKNSSRRVAAELGIPPASDR